MGVGGGVEAADQGLAGDAVVVDGVDCDAGRLVVGRDQIAPRAVGGHITGICQSGVERVQQIEPTAVRVDAEATQRAGRAHGHVEDFAVGAGALDTGFAGSGNIALSRQVARSGIDRIPGDFVLFELR